MINAVTLETDVKSQLVQSCPSVLGVSIEAISLFIASQTISTFLDLVILKTHLQQETQSSQPIIVNKTVRLQS